MAGTRMIICDCGFEAGPDQLAQYLAECGAEVGRQYQLISGVAAGMTPEALQRFFTRFPKAKVLPDRQRQLPPTPFTVEDMAEAVAPPTLVEERIAPEGLDLMGVPQVHALGIDGSGVRVCVIDSGIDFNHPDLVGTAILGHDGKPLAADFTETDLVDTVGHGTAVAGCIASQGRLLHRIVDQASGRAIARAKILGVAPGAKLMSAKVFDARVPSGYDTAIIAALEWAAEQGAQIVNMSLGGVSLPNDGSDPLARAVTKLREQGILVVVSAGNEGQGHGTLMSPASSPGSLTVGASTMYRAFAEMGFLAQPDKWSADQLAAFSSLGPSADGRVKPEILAPGAFDWGLAPMAGAADGQGYQLFGGTSQAAPLMAGVAALVMQAGGGGVGPAELVRLVMATADDLGLPPLMQGAGRVNALRAVQAALGQVGAVLVEAPESVKPGGFEVTLTNRGLDPVRVPISAVRHQPLQGRSFTGRIARGEAPQQIHFEVPGGIDLVQISLDWPPQEHGPQSARLLLAVYDPDGNFVNYQRPNGAGDLELGHSVDTWVTRPRPGRWSVQVQVRLGISSAAHPYTLSIRPFSRQPWPWISGPDSLLLAPGERRSVVLEVAIPEGAEAGAHTGHLLVGQAAIPLAVSVPISLEEGRGRFAGAFQHGYQGSYGHGDWHYHDLPVPAGSQALIASLQWPDVHNALEFYLIDPKGATVMGRSNNADIMDDGQSHVMGKQIIYADPVPGVWRLLVHSFGFCGRGEPEPYTGVVKAETELIAPRTLHALAEPGRQATLALSVRNPGRLPLTVQAVAQSQEPKLIWRELSGSLELGVEPDGRARGEGHIALGSIEVPFGARQVGVVVTWDRPETQVAVRLLDPVTQSDRATATVAPGQSTSLESNPVPGAWTVMAGSATPEVESGTIQVRGAIFLVAPQRLGQVEAAPVTVQPGGQAELRLRISLPEGTRSLSGQVLVTTVVGDRLGEIPFLVEAVSVDAEVAAADTCYNQGEVV